MYKESSKRIKKKNEQLNKDNHEKSIESYSVFQYYFLSAPAWAQWTDPGNDGTGDIHYNNGNVGIGTSAPTQKLHVEGDILSGGQSLFLGSSRLYANQDKLLLLQ